MKRQAEAELMDGEDQARAYAQADFSEPHGHFIELLAGACQDMSGTGMALDLGCGAGDISVRFARAFETWTVHGLDGSRAMLRYGYEAVIKAGLESRVVLAKSYLPEGEAPVESYDLVFSNGLLHHLPQAQTLWQAIKRWAAPAAEVFVMDLLRPCDTAQARKLVQDQVGYEPEILQRDFHNSLLAAYSIDEVEEQLLQAELSHLQIKQVSDRHLTVSGRLMETAATAGIALKESYR